MPRPRTSQLELNFDGLADSVTNLVGALILLIVLLIGVTQRAVIAPPPGTVRDDGGAESSDEAETTLAQFLQQVTLLRSRTLQNQHRCESIQQDVSGLKADADQLLHAAAGN